MQTPKRALLIGPSYGSHLPYYCGPLQGTENDLTLMTGLLSRNGFQAEGMKVLEGDMASRASILSSLEELSSTAPRGSVVVIYFSGHGYQLDEEFDQGLLPAGLTTEMVDEYHIYDVCITGEHFKPHLLKLIQKGCLVNTIFDCCYSGRMYRGFVDSDGPSLAIKKLKLSNPKYVEKYREILKSRGVHVGPQPQPVEHGEVWSDTGGFTTAVQETLAVGEPMEHEPSQETQPPSPMDQQVLLAHPVQEFWTPMLKSQGWTPSQHDKFIHIAASASNELAYENQGFSSSGCLTSALVEAIDEVQQQGTFITYSILRSLIRRKFSEKKWTGQTPQFEGGNMDMVIFDFHTVAQPKAFEICEAFEELAFKKVVLNAGKLHGVVEGEYDVYAPELQLTGKETKDQLSPLVIGGYWVDRIIINQPDIGMLKSRGTAVYKREERGARVGCKAIISLRRSMHTSAFVKAVDVDQEVIDQMHLAIENQNMFAIEIEERPHCITLDIKVVEGKNCWRACQYGRMIVPYQETGDEHLMAKNLSKYFRHRFAIRQKPSNAHTLTNVTFKVFKVEKVPSYKGLPDKKTELIQKATNTEDLYGEFRVNEVPTFRAHKVELATSMNQRSRYKVVDETGDAVVIQITNNENRPIHVCVVSYQADGSIVILYPPKKGHTEVLKPGESATTIRRILLEPDTVRRMVEPDFDLERPPHCTDTLVLYATSEQTDYEPLTQTAIELSPKLSTRGPNNPDRWPLAFANKFRDALRPPRPQTQSARDGHAKWLTIRRDIRILYNDN